MKVKTIALQMSFSDNLQMIKTYIDYKKIHDKIRMVWLVRSKFRYHQTCGSLMDYDAIY